MRFPHRIEGDHGAVLVCKFLHRSHITEGLSRRSDRIGAPSVEIISGTGKDTRRKDHFPFGCRINGFHMAGRIAKPLGKSDPVRDRLPHGIQGTVRFQSVRHKPSGIISAGGKLSVFINRQTGSVRTQGISLEEITGTLRDIDLGNGHGAAFCLMEIAAFFCIEFHLVGGTVCIRIESQTVFPHTPLGIQIDVSLGRKFFHAGTVRIALGGTGPVGSPSDKLITWDEIITVKQGILFIIDQAGHRGHISVKGIHTGAHRFVEYKCHIVGFRGSGCPDGDIVVRHDKGPVYIFPGTGRSCHETVGKTGRRITERTVCQGISCLCVRLERQCAAIRHLEDGVTILCLCLFSDTVHGQVTVSVDTGTVFQGHGKGFSFIVVNKMLGVGAVFIIVSGQFDIIVNAAIYCTHSFFGRIRICNALVKLIKCRIRSQTVFIIHIGALITGNDSITAAVRRIVSGFIFINIEAGNGGMILLPYTVQGHFIVSVLAGGKVLKRSAVRILCNRGILLRGPSEEGPACHLVRITLEIVVVTGLQFSFGIINGRLCHGPVDHIPVAAHLLDHLVCSWSPLGRHADLFARLRSCREAVPVSVRFLVFHADPSGERISLLCKEGLVFQLCGHAAGKGLSCICGGLSVHEIAAVCVKDNRVGIRCPLGIQDDFPVLLWCQLFHKLLLGVGGAGTVLLGIPSGKRITGTDHIFGGKKGKALSVSMRLLIGRNSGNPGGIRIIAHGIGVVCPLGIQGDVLFRGPFPDMFPCLVGSTGPV